MFGLSDVFVVSDPHSLTASNSTTALGVGVIPLLTAAPRFDDGDLFNNRSRFGGIQFWPNQLKPCDQNRSEQICATTSCQDCGNQAKKDCKHKRCRSCCKSRGFDCVTHVKSTWVSAARRRERQLMNAAAGSSVVSTSGAKKPRLVTSQTTTTSHTSTSNTTPTSFDISSGHHQDGSFKEGLPGEIRAMAVFKCVRVTAVDDGEDEYAYQAMVKIGGHLFKGFLYDQGVATTDEFPNLSDLHLAGSGSHGGDGGGRKMHSSTAPIIHHSDVYEHSGGGRFIAGSGYGHAAN